MGIIKIPSNIKVPMNKTSIVNIDPPTSHSVSPAPSSIVSQDSGVALLPVTAIIKEDGKAKRKKPTAQSQAAKTRRQRIKNILWAVLFGVLIAATLIVVAALARSLTQSIREGAISLPCPLGRRRPLSPLSRFNSKSVSDVVDEKESVCIHRRSYWEPNGQNVEILHDFSSKFSAIAEHNYRRCLIFDMHNSEQKTCPPTYPWNLDPKLGIPVCRGPLSIIAPVRRVLRQISNHQEKNITYTGSRINAVCSKYASFKVEKVLVQYFDMNHRRVAKRSVESAIEKLMETEAKEESLGKIRNDSDEYNVKPMDNVVPGRSGENGITSFIMAMAKKFTFWAPPDSDEDLNSEDPFHWEIHLSTVNPEGAFIESSLQKTPLDPTKLTELNIKRHLGAKGRNRRTRIDAMAGRKAKEP